MLLDPSQAPSEKWRDFFAEHNQDEMRRVFSKIECEVESDLAIIEETLYRRHTGSQDGVGQSQWDPEAKSNFLQRTGKDSAGLAETIEKVLKAENLISADAEIPRSNLDRLLSSEPIRKRAGISFAGGALVHLGNKQENLRTLHRIANDLSSRKIVLGDLWNNVGKNKYLDELKNDGFAIDRTPNKHRKQSEDEDDSILKPAVKTRSRAPKDKNLIARTDQNPFVNLADCERADQIWRELQFHLEFEIHANAIAVLMRVLLDLAITHYARMQGMSLAKTILLLEGCLQSRIQCLVVVS